MPRRRVAAKREVLPDPKFGNITLAKFMNHVMISGKKSVAEKIVYGALDSVSQKQGNDPVEMFEQALEAIQPMVEVKSRRVGGATTGPAKGPLPTSSTPATNFKSFLQQPLLQYQGHQL